MKGNWERKLVKDKGIKRRKNQLKKREWKEKNRENIIHGYVFFISVPYSIPNQI